MRAVTARTSTHGYYHTPRHRWIPLKPTPMSECELTAVFLCLNFGGNFVSSSESCRSIYYISRCKDSANRVKCQRKNLFSLNFRDGAYLSHIQKVAIYYKVIVFFYVSLLNVTFLTSFSLPEYTALTCHSLGLDLDLAFCFATIVYSDLCGKLP